MNGMASRGRELGLLGAYVRVASTGCGDGLNMRSEGNGGTKDAGLANPGLGMRVSFAVY